MSRVRYERTGGSYGITIQTVSDVDEVFLGILLSNMDGTYSPNRDVALHLTRLVGGEVADWVTAHLYWPVWKALFDHVLADE